MMALNFLFIGMGIVSIAFLIYLLVTAFKDNKPTVSHPSLLGGEAFHYAATHTIRMSRPNRMSRPKKAFSPKVERYNKNVRVDNIVVLDHDDSFIDVDPIGMALDVADVADTITYMNSQPSEPYPQIDVIATPLDTFNQPSLDDNTTPRQDAWLSQSSLDIGSSASYSDSSSSSSSSYDSGSSSSYDSGSSSSYDSSSSSSYDSGSSSSYDSSSSSSYDSGSSSSSFDSGSSW